MILEVVDIIVNHIESLVVFYFINGRNRLPFLNHISEGNLPALCHSDIYDIPETVSSPVWLGAMSLMQRCWICMQSCVVLRLIIISGMVSLLV